MTETQSRAASRRVHSPEYDFAREALRALRADLLERAAFGYRPLPRRKPDRSRLMPHTVAAWLPHLTVGFLALITFGIGTTGEPGLSVLNGVIPAAAVLLTLVRPVAAFWLSLLSAPVLAISGDTFDGWPWLGGSFAGHLSVLGVVALRTRPRTAAWMYALTALYAGIGMAFPQVPDVTDALPFLFVAAVLLLGIAVRQVRRAARSEVTAERQVTAVERSRRTLLEERSTIARELHDVVAHHMSVVAIQAEAAPYRVENPPPELERAFTVIRENAVSALAELRRVLGVVRAEGYEAPETPQPGLAALHLLLENVREAGLTVNKTVTGAVRELPQGVELSAYRIVQEALSNVLRHAPGAAAEVELSYVLGGFGLRVVNGPAKSPVSPSPGAGHGVTGMRERVAMLEGEITAGPVDGGGYEVAVFLPVARDDRPSDAAAPEAPGGRPEGQDGGSRDGVTA